MFSGTWGGTIVVGTKGLKGGLGEFRGYEVQQLGYNKRVFSKEGLGTHILNFQVIDPNIQDIKGGGPKKKN